MDFLALFVISIMIAGSVIYLVNHAKIKSTMFGKPYSPRLLICKFLVPADIILTITLVLGPMISGISGIMAFVAGGFTAVGLSLGVFFTKKVLMPRWKRQYEALIQTENEPVVIRGEVECL